MTNAMSAHRLGGASFIIGSLLLLAGNILHPRVGTTYQPLQSDALAKLITDNLGIFYASHTMLLVGPVILMLGFLTLYRLLAQKDERTYSLPSILSLGLSTALFVVTFLIDGFVDSVLAQNYLGASADAKQLAGVILDYSELVALSFLASSLFTLFLGGGLISASLLRTKIYNRWFAWVGVLLGLIGVLGYVAGIFGPYWIFSPLFAPYSITFTVWVLVLGIFLYRGK